MLTAKFQLTATVTLLLALPCWSQTGGELETRPYRFLMQQNKAQVVMLSENRLIPERLATRLAGALSEVDERNRNGGAHSSNYLDLEEQLIAEIGPEASNLHMGRSRNDLGATMERMIMPEDLLGLLSLLAETRESMVELAEDHVDTVIPGYTHAVQAQPTTLAHYLSAFLHALERDEERLRETYSRINASPLGKPADVESADGER